MDGRVRQAKLNIIQGVNDETSTNPVGNPLVELVARNGCGTGFRFE
jgi:hypothetical protein